MSFNIYQSDSQQDYLKVRESEEELEKKRRRIKKEKKRRRRLKNSPRYLSIWLTTKF